MSVQEVIQDFGHRCSRAGGKLVHDFDEYTFHAPRAGYFLGDSLTPDGNVNPVTVFELAYNGEQVPPNSSSCSHPGRLDIVPPELLCHIASYLDICAFLSLRRVDQRT